MSERPSPPLDLVAGLAQPREPACTRKRRQHLADSTMIGRLAIGTLVLAVSACALAIPEPAELCESANAPAHCTSPDDVPPANGDSLGEADDLWAPADATDDADAMQSIDAAGVDALDGTPEPPDGANQGPLEQDALGGPRCDRLASARIVELFVDPEGADAGAEFVEVWVPAAPEGLIEVVFYNGDNPSPYATALVPEGIGELRVLGAGGNVPLPATIQNGPDSVSLQVCGSRVQRIAYSRGDDTVPPGAESALIASGVGSVRCPSRGGGADSEVQPATELSPWGFAEPTPGEHAAVDGFLHGTCARPCQPLDEGDAWINELRYDPPGADGAGESEFIELMASRSIDWSTLSLETINGSNGEAYGDPMALDGEGRWAVIGGSEVPYTTQPLSRAMQNGPDGLLLLSCGDHIIDAVFYGDTSAEGALEGAPAPDVSGPSIGRDAWGTDTNDNASDFDELPRITPGAPNF